MFQRLPHPPRAAWLVAGTAIALLALAGCQTSGLQDITGSIDDKADVRAGGDPRRDLDTW